jgi:hypothetical protein
LKDSEALGELLLDFDFAPSFLPGLQREENPEIFDLFQKCVDEELMEFPKEPKAMKEYLETIPEPAKHILKIQRLAERELTQRDIASYVLSGSLEQPFFMLERSLKNKGKVLDKFPQLTETMDKDGLIHPDGAMRLLDNGMAFKGHLIYYHQFMRRKYTGSINWKFFERLQTLPKDQIAFAIDTFRLLELSKMRVSVEADYWYGPKFNSSTLDDPNSQGYSQHVGDSEDLFFPTIRSEFYVHVRDHEKIFEIEEIIPPNRAMFGARDFVINRYVHSIRNMSEHAFVHLDGAVKIYSKSSYEARVATKLPLSERGDSYIKLFRVDGQIRSEDWAYLICSFFRQNRDVQQFLGGPDVETG